MIQISSKNLEYLAIAHIISECLVAVGFVFGVFSYFFAISMYWVFPLVIVNIIISSVAKDKTFFYTLSNLLLAFFCTIPVIGNITSLAGIIVSLLAIIECISILNLDLNQEKLENTDKKIIIEASKSTATSASKGIQDDFLQGNLLQSASEQIVKKPENLKVISKDKPKTDSKSLSKKSNSKKTSKNSSKNLKMKSKT